MTIHKIISSSKNQLVILLIVVLGLNINTLSNQFAMDDVVVLTGNSLVQKGIHGIPEILKTEYFYGSENRNSELSAGRYRPIALVMFALEFHFFGMKPWLYHLVNILLFAWLVALLYNLLNKYIFRRVPEYMAFITCLLFITHPVHTEVIANIKSGDELITFIFLIYASLAFIRFGEKKNIKSLLLGLFFFFLALLTRESAVPFIVLVPLTAYFFFNQSFKSSILLSFPLILTFIIYMILRTSIVGFSFQSKLDIQDAPFLFATGSQAFATKILILCKYIGLLIFPNSLSCDYSYNQIPYINLFSLAFVFSAILILSLIVYALITLKKRSVVSFSVLYFFISIFLFSNFIIDIGAPLAERLLFQASLAFCIPMALLYLKLKEKSAVIATFILLIILVLFSTKTILRNMEWKSNETLYLSAIKTSPNSIRVNNGAADIYLTKAYLETDMALKKSYFRKTIYYSEHSLAMYPDNERIHDYLIAAYEGLIDLYNAVDLFFEDNNIDRSNEGVNRIIADLSAGYYKQGNGYYEQTNFDEAIKYYLKCIKLNNNHVEAWYNLGGNYFLKNDTASGIQAWKKVMQLEPNHRFNKEDFSNK